MEDKNFKPISRQRFISVPLENIWFYEYFMVVQKWNFGVK